MKRHILTINRQTRIILLLLLLIAGFLRFYNVNWDSGHLFHPDERNIANAVSALTLFTQMDPKFYAYGGFIIYLYKFTADLLVLILQDPTIAKDWGWINVIGRSYSAFFSVVTIIPLYLLGKKIFNHWTGILACVFYAFCVSSIQLAHYSITENLLTLLLVLITYLTLAFYTHPRFKMLCIISVLIGVSVATKTTGVTFFLAPVVTLCLLYFQKKLPFKQVFFLLSTLFILAFIVFSIFSPFTFLNWKSFMDSMHYENGVVLGTYPVVYTLQFLHTLPYIFQIQNLFWQIGPVMFFALLGIIVLTKHEIKKRRAIFLIFICFPLFYFCYVGSWYTKFVRYMVPIIPFLLLIASHLLVLLSKKYRSIGLSLSTILVLLTILWAVAFHSIFTHEQTRISASQWIYTHIPKGSTILTEHWDEGLPVPLPGYEPASYQQIPLTIYEPDNEIKLDYYANYLSTADYISITSRRLYGTLTHLPEKYPLTKRYYELLFSGKLGYTKVAEFSSYPSLFGISINDDAAEETFQVYDHPKSLVFKNTSHFSFEQLRQILGE